MQDHGAGASGDMGVFEAWRLLTQCLQEWPCLAMNYTRLNRRGMAV